MYEYGTIESPNKGVKYNRLTYGLPLPKTGDSFKLKGGWLSKGSWYPRPSRSFQNLKEQFVSLH